MSIKFYELKACDTEVIREILGQYMVEQQANAKNKEAGSFARQRLEDEVARVQDIIHRMRFFTFPFDE